MKEISKVLLFDCNSRLVVYLRDDNPAIPFPNHWDLFGGHLEAGETPEQALVREVAAISNSYRPGATRSGIPVRSEAPRESGSPQLPELLRAACAEGCGWHYAA